MLKAYLQDWKWNAHWNYKLTSKDAMKYIKKLLRHFKLKADIYFTTYKTGYASYSGFIKLPKKDISLGMIAHEIGHLLAYKNGQKGHNKKAYKYINRIYRYSIRYIPTKELLKINDNLQLTYKGE